MERLIMSLIAGFGLAFIVSIFMWIISPWTFMEAITSKVVLGIAFLVSVMTFIGSFGDDSEEQEEE